jgi:hypothetical protein
MSGEGGYRDQLDAALARVAVLERALEDARARIAELESGGGDAATEAALGAAVAAPVAAAPRDAAPAKLPTPDALWAALADAVVDRDGNLYCCGAEAADDGGGGSGHGGARALGGGEGGGDGAAERAAVERAAVWALGPDLSRRWVSRALPAYPARARLALAGNDQLLLWEPGKHRLQRLTAYSGRLYEPMGGAEPPGAEVHHLDLADAASLTADVNGTLLAIIHWRLLRFDGRDGAGLPTWAPRRGLAGKVAPEPMRPLYRGEARQPVLPDKGDASFAEDRPIACPSANGVLHVGWDEHVYLVARHLDSPHPWLGRYDRDGSKQYLVRLPFARVGGRAVADARGYAYVVGDDGQRLACVRVAPDGKAVEPWPPDGGAADGLGKQPCAAVLPDGALWLVGDAGAARRFRPDGRLSASSESRHAGGVAST